MRTFLADLWDRLRTSLWFIPSVMTATAIPLAFLLVRVQGWVTDEWMYQTRWLAGGDPDGARQILATIAGSIITVTGVIFSVTIVALSLASQQFGPRLLRNFMRDRGNQIVLGTFIGTFLYSMLVLRVVHEPGDDPQIPYLAVTFAVLLAVVALGVLIYFIHHVVVSIQADTIVVNVSRELHATMDELYAEKRVPAQDDDPVNRQEDRHDPDDEGRPVRAVKAGYVHALDEGGLIELAEKNNLVLHIVERPGKFVIEGMIIARVHGDRAHAKSIRDRTDKKICSEFLFGRTRSSEQDIEFSIAQLVEIAVRSLSPSLNDPFTAMSCLDHLGEALSNLGQRPMPKKRRHYCDGRLRVIIDQPSFEGTVNLSFDQIRQNARGKPAVLIRMLEVISMVLDRLEGFRDCHPPLLAQARMIARSAEESIDEPADREAIAGRFDRLVSRFDLSLSPVEGASERRVTGMRSRLGQ